MNRSIIRIGISLLAGLVAADIIAGVLVPAQPDLQLVLVGGYLLLAAPVAYLLARRAGVDPVRERIG